MKNNQFVDLREEGGRGYKINCVNISSREWLWKIFLIVSRNEEKRSRPASGHFVSRILIFRALTILGKHSHTHLLRKYSGRRIVNTMYPNLTLLHDENFSVLIRVAWRVFCIINYYASVNVSRCIEKEVCVDYQKILISIRDQLKNSFNIQINYSRRMSINDTTIVKSAKAIPDFRLKNTARFRFTSSISTNQCGKYILTHTRVVAFD